MSGEEKKPKQKHWCVNHPGIEAVTKCSLCGKHLCENCFVDLAGKKTCTDCKPAIIGEFYTGESALYVPKRKWKPFRIGRNVIKRLREQRYKKFFGDLPRPEEEVESEEADSLESEDEYIKPEKPDPRELYMQWLRDTAKDSTIDEEILWVGMISILIPFVFFITWILYSKYHRDVKNGYHNTSNKAVIGLLLSFIPLGYMSVYYFLVFLA